MAPKLSQHPPIHPDLAAKKYFKRIQPLLKQMATATRDSLKPALDYYRVARELEMNTDSRCDSSPGFFRKAKAQFEIGIKKASQESTWTNEQVAKIVKPSYGDTATVAKGNLTRMKVPTPHPDPKHQAEYLQRNVELIQTIPQRSFSTLARLIDKHIESNATVETLAKTIESRYHVSESQAALIATDQVQKLNSEFTTAAFIEAGVTEGTWMSMEDELVRPTHAYANGKTYNLEKGLFVDGEWTQPGLPINCRCYCMPTLSKTPVEAPTETPVEAPVKTPTEAPQATPVEQVWGEALKFTKTETPQAEIYSRDLQAITEASPLVIKTVVDKGATINIDLKSKTVAEAIRYNKKLAKAYGNVADQIESIGVREGAGVTGVVVGERHVVISAGGSGSESLLGHEFGHVIDFQGSRGVLSNADSWRKTWEKWIKEPAPLEAKWSHSYFTNPEHGPREAFAELYGHVVTRGKTSAAKMWGSEMTNEMISTLKAIDPKIKIGK